MDGGIRRVRVAWAVGLVSLLLVVGAMPARAAFPGANGLLIVQPASGSGLLLVGATGAHPRQICGVGTQCADAQDPVWSPDGSEIAAVSSQGSAPDVIYPDGACLACAVPGPLLDNNEYEPSWGPNVGPGFLPDGRLALSIEAGYPPSPQLGAMNTDGSGFQPFATSGSWQQTAWSPSGQLAAVRSVKRKPEVFVIDPAIGSARQLTRDGASSPSWSPDGRRLAVVHDGWIELIGSGGGPVRRLTRGRVPAWAPNGNELAFVGAHDRLYVISVRGGRPRPVGQIRAVRVDWQPVTGRPSRSCQAPAGSYIAAASPDATVAIDPRVGPVGDNNPAFSVLGCLTSNGRERLLESFATSNYDDASGVGPVAVAGDYAAVVDEQGDFHYWGGFSASVAVYDLQTGTTVTNLGGESAVGLTGGAILGFEAGIDQLVLGPDGITAARTYGNNCSAGLRSCTTVEQIVANDSTGTHILDSITTPGIGATIPSSLSQLALSGHTLTWTHAGTPERAQLN